MTPRTPLSLPDAVKVSHHEGLVAMRDRLAEVMAETTSARDLAPLASRLQAVLAELAKMDAATITPEPFDVEDGIFDPSTI